MEDRINQTSALSTTFCPLVERLVESIGLLLLKIDNDMASADGHTILAQTP
jgi:hypothetical protein